MADTAAAMRALAERLERATGESDELNYQLGDLDPKPAMFLASYNYTGSLDAAVALVERVRPGWGWAIHKSHSLAAAMMFAADETLSACREGNTPALALLLTLVASLIEEAEGG